MTESNAGGYVPGSQLNFLAVRHADSTYELRDGVTMTPIPEIEITLEMLQANPSLVRIFPELLDIYPELLETYPDLVETIFARRQRQSVPSVIDAALAKLHSRHFGKEVGEGMSSKAVERIRKIYGDDEEDN